MLPPELFSKRQLARMGLGDPAKYRHFLPRLSRAEAGSFADEYVAEEFDIEVRGWRCCKVFVGLLLLLRCAVRCEEFDTPVGGCCSCWVVCAWHWAAWLGACCGCAAVRSVRRLARAERWVSTAAGRGLRCLRVRLGSADLKPAVRLPRPAHRPAQSELYPSVPEDEPLYDLRQVVPEIYQPR